jgi:hypothetical protein
MALLGKIFAERQPVVPGKKRRGTQKALDFSEIACTEFGTLPRETITRLGLRHVYTMPVVLEDKSTKQILIYQAEVLEDKKWRTVYVQEDKDEDEG